MKSMIRNSPVYRTFSAWRDCANWKQRQYAAPSPHHIKQACLLRNGLPNATWVETGTYLGHTTRLLAAHARQVYSIEPEPSLYAKARHALRSLENVEILNGPSEEVLPSLLPRIQGDVNFWLDGHYSAGCTFKGNRDTPILEELQCIRENLVRLGRIRVLIDDIRCFDPSRPEYAGYPPLDVLVDWARALGLSWHIEHDIFIARN